jgi:hypothetical protein
MPESTISPQSGTKNLATDLLRSRFMIMMSLLRQLNTSTELQNLTEEFADVSNSDKMFLFSVNLQVFFFKECIYHQWLVVTDKMKI